MFTQTYNAVKKRAFRVKKSISKKLKNRKKKSTNGLEEEMGKTKIGRCFPVPISIMTLTAALVQLNRYFM
jgi:hypothetical protein